MVDAIKKACADRLMTVSELEKLAKIPENSIYKWDKHSPSVERVARVAAVLEVTVDSLISGRKQDEERWTERRT